MAILTRRTVLTSSLALGAAGMLPSPHIANAAATTCEAWFAQGCAKEEDPALQNRVADYENASGNKVELSIVTFAPLRQQEVSALERGAIPALPAPSDTAFASLQACDA